MTVTEPNFDRWRGEISTKVEEYGRRLTGHDADIRELRVSANAATLEVAKLGTSVEGLRGDIQRALADQALQRQQEFTELQQAVANNRMTSKEKIGAVVIPLIVAFVSAMILLITTHTI